MAAPIRDESGKVWRGDDKRIKPRLDTARLAKGIANPKERPMIPTGWNVDFIFTIEETQALRAERLQEMVEKGGMIGLGTFRPIFGRYTVDWS